MVDEKRNSVGIEVESDNMDSELEEILYARHAEIETLQDLEVQRGTPIPALFNQFFKFIQNPSTVSIETFKRMVDTDDTIGSGVDFLTSCLAARLGRYQHPSNEITTFVNTALDKIDGGFANIVKEMLSATWTGFSVTEKVWGNDELGFIINKMVTLPPSTLLFETNRVGEITEDGILQYQRNYNPHLLGQGLGFFGSNLGMTYGFTNGSTRPDGYAKLGDFPYPIRTANSYNYLSIRIPKRKCVHYAYDAQGKFGNPYGRSLLRRCYKYYVMKDSFLQMMSVALDRKGTPLTIVFADPNTTLGDAKSYQKGARARQQNKLRADVAAAEAFKNVHNDSTIILPGKKGQIFDTDFVPQDSNTQSFIDALNFCNKSIMRALLIPSLVFEGGDGAGSYALGQQHFKTFDRILDSMLAGFVDTMLEQVVKELIAFNFPESAWKQDGVGDFGKRDLSPEEIDKELAIFEKGVNVGAVDMNDLRDLNAIRDKMGLEEREEVIEKPDIFGEFGGENEF